MEGGRYRGAGRMVGGVMGGRVSYGGRVTPLHSTLYPALLCCMRMRHTMLSVAVPGPMGETPAQY